MVALIYELCFGGENYIGSTFDYKGRMIGHKSCLKNGSVKSPYRQLREKGFTWEDVKVYVIEEYPEISKKEDLFKLETIWQARLKPTLNKYRAYTTEEEKKEYSKGYYQEYNKINKVENSKKKRKYYFENQAELKEKNRKYYHEKKAEAKLARKRKQKAFLLYISEEV